MCYEFSYTGMSLSWPDYCGKQFIYRVSEFSAYNMRCDETNKLNDGGNYLCMFFSVVGFQPVTPVTL